MLEQLTPAPYGYPYRYLCLADTSPLDFTFAHFFSVLPGIWSFCACGFYIMLATVFCLSSLTAPAGPVLGFFLYSSYKCMVTDHLALND